METADEQTSEMEHSAHALSKRKPASSIRKYGSGPSGKFPSKNERKSSTQAKARKCGLCGGTYPHRGKCPANGLECHKCGKLNHFASVCRSNPHRSNNHQNHRGNRSDSRGQHACTVDESSLTHDDVTKLLLSKSI